MYNIATRDGRTMLVHWVPLNIAQYWLSYYQAKYPSNKPYPNGRGFYPNFGFHLIVKD